MDYKTIIIPITVYEQIAALAKERNISKSEEVGFLVWYYCQKEGIPTPAMNSKIVIAKLVPTMVPG